MSRTIETSVTWILPIVALCVVMPGELRAQTIVRSFNGDKGPGPAVCQPGVGHCDRPELDVAVNGKQVVQVTWQNVSVYDYSGKLLRSTPMLAFVRNAGLDPLQSKGGIPIEPHIVYNEHIGRWIITVTCKYDCVMVSASSDPMGAWGGAYVSCQAGGPCLDYDPAIHVGYDKNGVYLCAGHMGDDNPNTVPRVAHDCFAVPSSEVSAIAQGKPPAHISRRHNMPLDVIPAIDNNPKKAANAPAFFVAKSCGRTAPNACQASSNFPFHWTVNTFTWNGATGTYNAGGGEQAVKTEIGSTQNKWLYNTPIPAPQAGNDTLRLRTTTSHRLMNVVQSGSHLYGALGSGPCTGSCGPQGEDGNNVAFWVELDCSTPASCKVSQTAKISGASFNPLYATVGVDEQGNVGIVASSSTATTNLGLMLWTRRKTDAPNMFTGPLEIIAGTQPYTCFNQSNLVTVGSATGILTARDPLDGTKLWTTQQWSDDATPCVWKTRIVQYQIVAPNVAKSLSSGGPPLATQATPTRPVATVQQLSAPDPAVTSAFTAFLKAHPQSAEEYVVSRFKTHDLVFLGEAHMTRPRLLFLQRLIPLLYKAGVHHLAYEMATTDDQRDIDRLVNADAYDEAAAFEILARWDFEWPYQEYADVFRAAWQFNKELPKGAPRFRILAIDVRPDYRRLLPGMDPMSFDSRGLIVGGDRDLVRNVRMADVLREEVVRKKIKALVFNGGGHSQTRYRRPGREPSFPRRMSVGYMIHSQIGDRAMSVMILGPQAPGKDAVTDLVMASLPPGMDSGGFDTKGSPIGTVLMKAGPDTVKVEDFFDGYAFIDMTAAWRSTTPNLRYITEARVRKAREEGLVPDDPAITAETVKKAVLEAAAKTDKELRLGVR